MRAKSFQEGERFFSPDYEGGLVLTMTDGCVANYGTGEKLFATKDLMHCRTFEILESPEDAVKRLEDAVKRLEEEVAELRQALAKERARCRYDLPAVDMLRHKAYLDTLLSQRGEEE